MKTLHALIVIFLTAGLSASAMETKQVKNEVSRKQNVAFGSFGYITAKFYKLELLTVPKKEVGAGDTVVSLVPEAGKIISRHEHLFWTPKLHTDAENLWNTMPIAGMRVYVTVQGWMKWHVESKSNGKSRATKPSPPPKRPEWWSNSIDLDLDADSDNDGKITGDGDANMGSASAVNLEDMLEDDAGTNPYGALVFMHEPEDLVLRQVLPKNRPVGTVIISSEAVKSSGGGNLPKGSVAISRVFSKEVEKDGKKQTVEVEESVTLGVTNLWKYAATGDVKLRMRGQSPGNLRLKVTYMPKDSRQAFDDAVRVFVAKLELGATDAVWGARHQIEATTFNKGTASSPRTYLTSIYRRVEDFYGKRAAIICLRAGPDDKFSEYLEPDEDKASWLRSYVTTWSVVQPSGAPAGKFDSMNYEVVDRGTYVRFYAPRLGKHTFTCAVWRREDYQKTGAVPVTSRSVVVYVAGPQIVKSFEVEKKSTVNGEEVSSSVKLAGCPKYVLANARGRIPIRFQLAGTDGAKFALNVKVKDFLTWVAEVGVKADTYVDLSGYVRQLKRFAPSLDSKSSENGKHNAYWAVSEYAKPPKDRWDEDVKGCFGNCSTISGTSGISESLRLTLNCQANLILEGEETNFSYLVGNGLGATGLRYASNEWQVVEIGESRTTFVGQFEGRNHFEHLSTRVNKPCAGVSWNTGKTGRFSPKEVTVKNDDGDDVTYLAFVGKNRHYYHPTKTWYAELDKKGFGWKKIGDMRVRCANVGFARDPGRDWTWEAKLLEDDFPNVTGEEFIARLLDAGTVYNSFVSYRTKQRPYLGSVLDIHEGLEGKVSVSMWDSCEIVGTTKSEADASKQAAVNIARCSVGAGLAVAGVLASIPAAPVWATVGIGIGVISVVDSSMNLLQVLAPETPGPKAASLNLLMGVGKKPWDAGTNYDGQYGGYFELPEIGTVSSGISKTFVKLGNNGAWMYFKKPVPVKPGDSLRAIFIMSATAQNASEALLKGGKDVYAQWHVKGGDKRVGCLWDESGLSGGWK